MRHGHNVNLTQFSQSHWGQASLRALLQVLARTCWEIIPRGSPELSSSPAQSIWHRLCSHLPAPVVNQGIRASCTCTTVSGISSGSFSPLKGTSGCDIFQHSQNLPMLLVLGALLKMFTIMVSAWDLQQPQCPLSAVGAVTPALSHRCVHVSVTEISRKSSAVGHCETSAHQTSSQ